MLNGTKSSKLYLLHVFTKAEILKFCKYFRCCFGSGSYDEISGSCDCLDSSFWGGDTDPWGHFLLLVSL